MEFFRFPRTPHLAWLAAGEPRHDKLLSPHEVRDFLAHEVRVEEKVDGANVGFSVDNFGTLNIQNRGSYLSNGSSSDPQFKPMFQWLEMRRNVLVEALSPELMLFGEWCFAVHSIRYTRLPDWFLAFDVYDRTVQAFWDTPRRNKLAKRIEVEIVPSLATGYFDLQGLLNLLGQSRFADAPAEGLYIRHESGGHLIRRAKLVRPEFLANIEQHWSKRRFQTNQLAGRQPL